MAFIKILVVFTIKALPLPPGKALVVQNRRFFFLLNFLVVGRARLKKSEKT